MATKLRQINSERVDFEVKFPGDEDEVKKRTQLLFKRFHKILRVAVDVSIRNFQCQITIESKERPQEVYTFCFESKIPQFEFTKGNVGWDIWDDLADIHN